MTVAVKEESEIFLGFVKNEHLRTAMSSVNTITN